MISMSPSSPERGHSCPQQRRTAQPTRDTSEPPERARLAADRNVRAPRLLGLLLLTWASASAQNFLKNPDFEQPLGPDNWTVVYTGVPTSDGGVNAPTNCGPNDFMVAGRTTIAHKDLVPGTWDGEPYYWSKFGGHFAPNHTWMMQVTRFRTKR